MEVRRNGSQSEWNSAFWKEGEGEEEDSFLLFTSLFGKWWENSLNT